MRILSEKYRSLAVIGAVLVAGLCATGATTYVAVHDAAQGAVAARVLPLASDAAFADLQAEFMRPAQVASLMAADSFARDWLLQGEASAEPIQRYLAELRQRTGAKSMFFASERTRRHYGSEGEPTALQENSAQDAWFFRIREAKVPFVIELGSERTNGGTPTLFVTQRMLDKDGNFLAAVGAGFSTEGLLRIIDSHRRRFDTNIYLIDAQHRVVSLGASATPASDTFDSLPGIGGLAQALLHNKTMPVSMAVPLGSGTMHVSSRFLPATGWHLLVEARDEAGTALAGKLVAINAAIGTAATLLALILVALMRKRYQDQLGQMAGSDTLTGLLNRQAFDLVFRQAAREADRYGRPLSGVLFDIDFIKQVNERHGNDAGDEVLRIIGRLVRGLLRESDIITRWNGEEFFVLLKECTLEQAVVVAEKIRQEVDLHDFSSAIPDGHVTISLGVAQHEAGETASSFFRRADEALFKAKMNGRNRLHVACSNSVSDADAELETGS